MLLLLKWGWECHKYIGKVVVEDMHHFVLGQIFESENLGLSLNLEEIWKFFVKIWKRKFFGEKFMI